jgi:hypothetical protein
MTDAPSPEGLPADPRDALIREQAERIAALEAVVADLRERLEAAERAGSRNSGNSSIPPSSDDQPGRELPRKQRRAAERAGKKKPGKQPGSPGAAMRWEVPDRAGGWYPRGACACGPDLADARTTSCSAGPGDRPHRHSPRNQNRNPRFPSPHANGLNV